MRILAWGGIILGFLLVIIGFTLQKQIQGHFLEPIAAKHRNPSFYRRMQGQALYFLAIFLWIPSVRVLRGMETTGYQFVVIVGMGLFLFGLLQFLLFYTNKQDY